MMQGNKPNFPENVDSKWRIKMDVQMEGNRADGLWWDFECSVDNNNNRR